MEPFNGQPSTFYTAATTSQPLNLRAVLARYRYHWPLFVAGVALALLGAYLYAQLVQPSYEVRASLLVEGEKKTPAEKSALQELDLATTPKVVESEMEILKSRRLMLGVVRDLQLGTLYQQRNRLGARDLYNRSPVQFALVPARSSPRQHVLNIVLKDQASFYVAAANGDLTAYPFGRPVSDSIGTWQLTPVPAFALPTGSRLRIVARDPDLVVAAYQKALELDLINKIAPAISLQIKDEVPQRGMDVLNQLMAAYNGAATAAKNKLTANTLHFIDSRLASLRGELSQAEADEAGYRSQQGLTDIASQSQVYLENAQANDSRLNEAQVQLAVVSTIERTLRDPRPAATVPTALGITDATLSSLVEKLTELHAQRERLLTTTPENNPLFNPLNSEILATQLAIRSSVKNIKASLLATVRELESFNSRFESSIKRVPGQERQLVGKKRQLTIKENLYTYLLQKREEASLSYAATLDDARIIDSAYVLPSKWPNRWLFYALAAIVGLVVPAALLQVKDALSTKITTRAEIERATRAPVLAELAFEKEPGPGPMVAPLPATSVLAEQVRGLRTRLPALLPDQPAGRVVLVTSSVSGEGKSFVSAHLAVSLAGTGQRTVLVDLDLRRPGMANLFGLANDHAGVSDFLTERVAWPAIVQPTTVSPNLNLIASGTFPAADLLEGPRLGELLTSLRGAYHHVVLDSPPLHLVADALLLAQASDLTLYVVRQGVTDQDELAFIEELNRQKSLPKLHLIFNGIDCRRYGYGYAYDRRYLKSA